MPGPNRNVVQKPKNLKRSAGQFLKSLGSYKWSFLVICILAAIATALTIFGPKILGSMTTSAVESLSNTGQIDWQPIVSALISLIVLYVASAIISYIEGFIQSIVSARYAKKLRESILIKISKLPMSYFDKVKYGDTLSRMTNDIDTITTSLNQSLTEIITSITLVIGILIMMLSISGPLSLIAIVSVPISLIFVGGIMGRAQKYFRTSRTALGTVSSTIEEDYTGQSIIKSNSHGKKSYDEFSRENERLYKATWKAQFFGSLAFPVVHIFTNLSYILICIVGGLEAIKGTITIGNVQAFIQYVNQFNRPITQVASIAATVQQTLAAAERVFDFLELPENTPDPNPAHALKNIKGAVEFHDVNFSYDKVKPIIKNFSAKITPGSQVAIVGPTGAGKTTIVNLLMRFYDPDSGYITIDGIPTTEITRGDVRKNFGMVLQDTWLFSGTIYENLRYGRPDATLDEIKKSAKIAGIDHFIEALPHGYHAKIDEDSDNISAGEKQLLTIARAMIADPPMIILDEATSNVDTRTEQLVQAAFDKLTHGRTSIVIAHRLSTIRNADLILVMKDGNIIEQGNHAELLKKNGFYAELYNSQFSETAAN